jgi:hypothetical protein
MRFSKAHHGFTGWAIEQASARSMSNFSFLNALQAEPGALFASLQHRSSRGAL